MSPHSMEGRSIQRRFDKSFLWMIRQRWLRVTKDVEDNQIIFNWSTMNDVVVVVVRFKIPNIAVTFSLCCHLVNFLPLQINLLVLSNGYAHACSPSRECSGRVKIDARWIKLITHDFYVCSRFHQKNMQLKKKLEVKKN